MSKGSKSSGEFLGGSLEGYRKFKPTTDFRSELSEIMQVPLNDCSYNAVVERVDSFCFECAINENSVSVSIVKKSLKRIVRASSILEHTLQCELIGQSGEDHCSTIYSLLNFHMEKYKPGCKQPCQNVHTDIEILSVAAKESLEEAEEFERNHNFNSAFDKLIFALNAVSEREGFPVSSRKDDGSSGKASPFVELVWCCLNAAKESRGVSGFLHSKGGLANRVSASLKRLREKEAGLKNQI